MSICYDALSGVDELLWGFGHIDVSVVPATGRAEVPQFVALRPQLDLLPSSISIDIYLQIHLNSHKESSMLICWLLPLQDGKFRR